MGNIQLDIRGVKHLLAQVPLNNAINTTSTTVEHLEIQARNGSPY